MIVDGKEVNKAMHDIKAFGRYIFRCENKSITFKHLANSLIKNWSWKKDEVKLLKETILKNRKTAKELHLHFAKQCKEEWGY